MKLSIILPVYNVEKYIAKCINSILNIPDNNFELIIVDDCGKDNSIAIAQNILKNTNIIYQVIKHSQNSGLAIARNTGLKHASGEYIYFLDSDDYIDSDLFYTFFNQGYKSQSDILIGDYFFVKDTGIIKNTSIKEEIFTLNGPNFFKKYYNKSGTVIWRHIYKHNFLKSNKLTFSNLRFQEDSEFSPRALYKAKTITYIPTAFYYYRIRNDSLMTVDYNSQRFYDNLKVVNYLYDFVKQENIQSTYKQAFYNQANATFLYNIAAYAKRYRLSSQENEEIQKFLIRMHPTKIRIFLLKFCSTISYNFFIKVVTRLKSTK
jgi:glycosyltransferase involved in cell wall biosynthesis